MRNSLLGSIGIALLTVGSTQAADLPVKAPAPAPAVIDWSGIYVGGHAGYVGSRIAYTFMDDLANTEDMRFAPSSFMGGAQIGLQRQFDKWVLGLEGTWSSVNLTQTLASAVSAGQTRSINVDEMATATIRFGVPWEQALLYAKGGYAGVRTNIHSADSALGVTADITGWKGGWTIGAGAEYMAYPNIVVGAEFDYYNFNFDNSNGLYSDGATPFTVSASNGDIYAITARLSYLFR